MQGSFAFGSAQFVNRADWKVLIYMQADNDLEEYAYWDLAEMELVQNRTIPVFVEIDLPGNTGIKRIKVNSNPEITSLDQIDFSTYTLDSLKSEVIDEFGETEFAQDGRLMKFLIEMEERHPTKHTMLVIWGHGEGFGADQLAQFGGIAIDEYPSMNKITVSGLKNILNTHHAVTGKKIDVLSMDACLMQTFEVTLEMMDKVDYIVGSTQIQDFRGLPYDEVLQYMSNTAELSPYQVAIKIPELFEERARDNFGLDKRTMSAVNVNELKFEFLPKLDKVAREIIDYLDQDPFHRLDLLSELRDLPFFLGESRDFASLLSHLEEFFLRKGYRGLAQTMSEALTKLNKANLAYYYGDYYIYEHRLHLGSFKAFGVWMPASIQDYNLRKHEFRSSKMFNLIPNWKNMFEKLYGRVMFPEKNPYFLIN